MAEDSAPAVEFMDRMIETIGLKPGLPEAEVQSKLASLHGEIDRAFSDPDLRDAALAYLDRWTNEVELGSPDRQP